VRKLIAVCSLLVLAPFAAATAVAGPFGDDMAKCMVRATSPADRAMVVQWIFAFIALHPDVRELASINDEKRAALNKRMADLTMALLTVHCAEETREAIKIEGMEVLKTSFGVLGRVAVQDLFANDAVKQGLTDFARNLDEQKIKELVEAAK
jgi:hypothetical protein